ncbi:MAG: rod shape-determining protein RodA [Chlorobi bacterium]|nr:rod shape-determining protein RodA [Chlorobiota bacterium]
MATTLYDNRLASSPTTESGAFRFDFRTFLVTMALVGIGLISIYSATYDSGASAIFQSQLVYAVAGLVVMVAVAFAPDRWLRMSSIPMYALGMLLLIAVLVIGTERYGQKNWIIIGSFSLQPSELMKIGTLMFSALFISREGKSLTYWRDLGTLIAIVVVPVGLIMAGKDTGSATVYMVMLMAIAFWGGADLFLLFSLVAPAIIGLVALLGSISGYGSIPLYVGLAALLGAMLLFRRRMLPTMLAFGLSLGVGLSTPIIYDHLPPHMQNRLATFLNPELDPQGAGYHVIQSMLAVGGGGLSGKGFLQGTQTQLRYIPEQWTDFIFCVPTEEFGFLGGVLVIGLLVMLIWFAVDTANHLRSRFESTICFGIAAVIFYHMTINIGMAIGLVPVMGIPLPFLSKGGSSLLLNMFMIGLLLNFYRFRTDVRRF